MKPKRYFIIILVILILMAKVKAQQEINLSQMPLKEKIAQMIMIRGDNFDSRFTELKIGGIFLTQQKTEEDYKKLIEKYQSKSKIRLLVATDLEGYWNPFPFYNSKSLSEIKTKEEAYNLGKEHAQILKNLGFNLDFSPIAEEKNTVWPGRSFTGSHEEIKEKISFYINGLQDNKIMATAKHYPGGSMIKDPHKFKVMAKIEESDLDLFNEAIKNNVSAIMIGHPMVSGAIDSKGKQSTVSKEVISTLRKDFSGLIVTDAISMLGLKISYLFRSNGLYVDLVSSGNDLILDLPLKFSNYNRVKNGINAIEKAVKKGKISQERIDVSVKRILERKGYLVYT
jgi:beta-N-acetylhexosaminidase